LPQEGIVKKYRFFTVSVFLPAVLAAVFLMGCEEKIQFDVTLKNGLQRAVGVNITSSQDVPSAVYTLEKGESRAFTGLDQDDYYVHLIVDTKAYFLKLAVTRDVTWVIKMDGSGGYILE
jgi:hypothetical protein